jgi:hypothetical protein
MDRGGVQAAMSAAVADARIRLRISVHSLRHNSEFRIIPSAFADNRYLRGFSGVSADLTRHNQRLFRKANSSSSGL